MKWTQCLWGLGVVGMLVGCANTLPPPNTLTARGRQVTPLAAAPGQDCKNLGMVVGTSGVYWDVEERLVDVMNDVRNKAAEKKATHLFTQPPELGARPGNIFATVVGYAYDCPADKYGALEDPSATSAGKSFLTDCPRQEGETLRERALRCRERSRGTTGE